MEVNDVTKYIMMSNNTEDLNHIKRMLQMRREDIARGLRHTLLPGDRVKVDSSRLNYVNIVKVKRTKAIVTDDNNQKWDIPLTLISTHNIEHKVR